MLPLYYVVIAASMSVLSPVAVTCLLGTVEVL